MVEFKADENGDYLDGLVGELGDYDQFEINKEKFNVQTTYSEKHYNTSYDINSIPVHVKAKAEKIHKDIINNIGENTNYHIKEERGIGVEGEDDEDEENKYSFVYRPKKA